MAYDEHLAERVAQELQERKVSYEEKKMFGGLCFMIDDKMCIGIVKEDFMARIDPELAEQVEKLTGCRPMDFTGKRMKGYYYVAPEGVDAQNDLAYWIDLCLQFNPIAKASKKRKKK